MAKDMRTQPTSRNSIPTSQNPDFGSLFFCIFVYFMCFETQNRVSRVLPWKCLTGVGYIDADWKVSTLEINMNFSLWTKSSKYEFQHLLTTKSSISGLWDFMGKYVFQKMGKFNKWGMQGVLIATWLQFAQFVGPSCFFLSKTSSETIPGVCLAGALFFQKKNTFLGRGFVHS